MADEKCTFSDAVFSKIDQNVQKVFEDCQRISFQRFKFICKYKRPFLKEGEAAHFTLWKSLKNPYEDLVEYKDMYASDEEYEQGESGCSLDGIIKMTIKT